MNATTANTVPTCLDISITHGERQLDMWSRSGRRTGDILLCSHAQSRACAGSKAPSAWEGDLIVVGIFEEALEKTDVRHQSHKPPVHFSPLAA